MDTSITSIDSTNNNFSSFDNLNVNATIEEVLVALVSDINFLKNRVFTLEKMVYNQNKPPTSLSEINF